MATPEATTALVLVELVGALALYVLNRMFTGPRVAGALKDRGDLA
jgi:hypothetical protein